MAKQSRKTSTPKIAARKSKRPARQAVTKRARKRVIQGASVDVLLAPMKGAFSRTVGGVQVAVASAGAARVKRMIYPGCRGCYSSQAAIVVTGAMVVL